MEPNVPVKKPQEHGPGEQTNGSFVPWGIVAEAGYIVSAPVCGDCPLPVNVAEIGLPGALWVILMESVFAPVEVGLNCTFTLQPVLGSNAGGQSFGVVGSN